MKLESSTNVMNNFKGIIRPQIQWIYGDVGLVRIDRLDDVGTPVGPWALDLHRLEYRKMRKRRGRPPGHAAIIRTTGPVAYKKIKQKVPTKFLLFIWILIS